jgi:integrase
MGSIRALPNGRRQARYRDASGQQHAKKFSKVGDARSWLAQQEAAVVKGEHVDPRAGRVRVRDYAAGWQAQHVGRAGSARILDNALRLHLLPLLGDRTMASVRRSDVQALVKALSGRLAPGSVRNVYDVAARMFSAAVDDRVIASSPCRRIVLPQAESTEVSAPTVEQVAALVETVEPRYRAAVVLLAGSGVRIGELLGLRASDVDWLRRTLRVERQRMQDGSIGPTKTARSVRTVPLGQVVIDELAAHLTEYLSSEWLFTTETGEPLGYRRWKKVWAAARPGEVDTHSLRHFYASALIAGGASVKQVQTVLGHSSAVITLRTYAHLWPGDDDRTRLVIDTVLTGLVHGSRTVDASADHSRRSEA